MFKPLSGNGRAAKRRRVAAKDESDDDFGLDEATQAALEDDDGETISSRHIRDGRILCNPALCSPPITTIILYTDLSNQKTWMTLLHPRMTKRK